MNKLVREHCPVSKLPEDLREGLDGSEDVTVTIDVLVPTTASVSDEERAPVPKPALFSRHRHIDHPRVASVEEVNDHVRLLRDEWDHRDR